MLEDNPHPSHDQHILESSRAAIRRSRELLLRTKIPPKHAAGIQVRIEELKKIPGARQADSLKLPD